MYRKILLGGLILSVCLLVTSYACRSEEQTVGTDEAKEVTDESTNVGSESGATVSADRLEGTVEISFTAPEGTTVLDMDLLETAWQWSNPVTVTITNNTPVDMIIPDYAGFYEENPVPTPQVTTLSGDLSQELNKAIISDESEYNVHLSFYVNDDYRIACRSENEKWLIPAGETANANFYLEANTLTAVCDTNAGYGKTCSSDNLTVQLIFGGDMYPDVDITNLPEAAGSLSSEPQSVYFMMQ